MAHGWPCVTGSAREGRTESRRARAGPSRSLALVIRPMVLAVVVSGWAWAAVLIQAAELEYEPDVILVIKEKAFHVVKGNAAGKDSPHLGFSLSPGEDITLELRNEDRVPHEFVSPLFTLVEFQFWGKATLVYTYTATGIRIEPGETVALRFELPKDFSGKQFKFWCNVHGKLHGDALQGEIFVVKSKPRTSQ
jgi:hypothetical protein